MGLGGVGGTGFLFLVFIQSGCSLIIYLFNLCPKFLLLHVTNLISLPGFSDSSDRRPHGSTQVLHAWGISVDVLRASSLLISRPTCVCPQPVLKSLFWLESQANFIILGTLSLLLKRCICSVLAHYLHTFSLFVPGPSEGNSHLLLLLCSPLPGPPLLFWSLQMGLDQSLISAVVPWSHEAHNTHTSITEMPFTQKFTHGAVKLIPKS